MALRFTVEAQAAIDRIAAEQPRSKTEQIHAAFTLAQYIVDLEDRKHPINIVIGNLEITNQPYRAERELWFKHEVAKLAPDKKSLLAALYDSAQLRPSFMGIGLDLKPILARTKEFFFDR